LGVGEGPRGRGGQRRGARAGGEGGGSRLPAGVVPPGGRGGGRARARGERGRGARARGGGRMGRLFKQYLNGKRIYSCSNCRCHTSDHDEIISKAFQGRHGRAYLFSNVVNITLGPREDRLLITGLHTVSDIYCSCCQQVLGWKYVRALLPLPLCPAPPQRV